MGPRASQDLRSPSPIMAPDNTEQINQDHLDHAAAKEPRNRSTPVFLSVPLMHRIFDAPW